MSTINIKDANLCKRGTSLTTKTYIHANKIFAISSRNELLTCNSEKNNTPLKLDKLYPKGQTILNENITLSGLFVSCQADLIGQFYT